MDTEKILEKLKISRLNEMQRKTADVMLGCKKDVVVLSPTGSGKTLAYLLPLVQMLDGKNDGVQAIVIVPGRELALQSYEVFAGMGSGLRAMCLYGGRAAMDEHRVLRKVRPQVLFVTPGRLNDHLDKLNVTADDVKYLVIDEFDKCLKMGFHDEMKAIIGRLPYVEKRVLLSATDADEIPGFVNMGMTERVDFLSTELVSGRISQYVVESPDKDKLETLRQLLCSFGESSTIVFLNYRDSVERVSGYLRDKGFVVSSLHGGMGQDAREDAVFRFGNGSSSVLVGTDLASRGLDIPEVDNIIHYHLPTGKDEYVHRVGRTGRWTSTGHAFFLLGPEERLPDYMESEPAVYELPGDVPEPIQPRMVTLYIGKGKKDKISKGDVLGFLCKTGGLKGDEIGRIDIKERCSYAAVSRKRYKDVIKRTAGEKLKGIKTIVEIIRD